MSSEWNRHKVYDIIDLISGGTPKTSVPEYWGGNIPWLSVADFNTGYRWVNKADKTITERAVSESSTVVLEKGDLIISARGTVGALAQLTKPMAFNQSCYGIRGKQGISDVDFLYYALGEAVTELKQVAHGGVFDTITRETFKIIELNLPPLSEQRAIAQLLGVLDKRIALFRETNATLEAIAQALFKSWFVDFDPVHAKQEGREPEGMDADTAALFPDSFEESELGLVPKGWTVGVLGDIAVSIRKQIPTSELNTELSYIGLEHMPRQSLSICNWDNAQGLESAKAAFSKGDILFGKLRPYFHKVIIAPFEGVCSTDILVCRSKQSTYYGIITMHLFSVKLVEYANRLSNGAKMPRVNWKDIAAYTICIPSSTIAKKYSNVVIPLFERMMANVHTTKTLESLRDTLLPRLISGQLRIPEAEALIEEASV